MKELITMPSVKCLIVDRQARSPNSTLKHLLEHTNESTNARPLELRAAICSRRITMFEHICHLNLSSILIKEELADVITAFPGLVSFQAQIWLIDGLGTLPSYLAPLRNTLSFARDLVAFPNRPPAR
jgi:hypothetical protein